MEFNPAILGTRLAEARVNRNLTQEQVAEELGIPRVAIVQIEAGNKHATPSELYRLATLYSVNIQRLFQHDVTSNDPLVVLARAAGDRLDDIATKRAVGRCFDLCSEGTSLERLLGYPSRSGPPSYGSVQPQSHADAVEQGHRAAENERRRLGLSDAPIASISSLIAEQGIWTCSTDLPDCLSGLFLSHVDLGMAILIRQDEYGARRRFSYAHEYAHALFDRDSQAAVTSRDNATNLVERRANAFAAAFLMPKAGVEAEITRLNKGGPSRKTLVVFDAFSAQGEVTERRASPGSQDITFRDVAEVAHHFVVSYEAAAYRIFELGFVNKSNLDKLVRDQKRLGTAYLNLISSTYREYQEPDVGGTGPVESDDTLELVGQILPLATEALSRNLISTSKLIDIGEKLGIPPRSLLELADNI